MAQTVTNTVIGVVVAEAQANAAKHSARNRTTTPGVALQESANNAVLNTITASE